MMMLRDRETGQIGELIIHDDPKSPWFKVVITTVEPVFGSPVNFYQRYNTLAELVADWENYDEQKEQWFLDYDGEILHMCLSNESLEKTRALGNCFETRDEAEKAVMQLKAWKRLKDDGFKINKHHDFGIEFEYKEGTTADKVQKHRDDLNMMFGTKVIDKRVKEDS